MGLSRCETTGDSMPRQLGRYRIEGRLGHGGMGVVYQGRDTQLGRVVAIKMLPERLAQDPESLGRFLREARVLAGLHHPNIAAIHGVGREADGARYLVLERVDGESLAARLARGRLAPREAIEACRQIARALAAAHERDVVHRDLKPSNVMLTPEGLVKVLDFGLAKRRDEASGAGPATRSGTSSAEPYVTLTGFAQGTPGYMSPEQVLGEAAGERADAFSFGCVLYECLTARRAFPGERVGEVLDATLESEPDWSALPAETPQRIRDLLRLCLAKDPKQRLAALGDAERELANALRAASEPGEGADPDAGARLHNLPAFSTRFVGREREIRECVELLRRARLVTLTGAGGCGKTRLAIRVAAELLERHPHGAWLCDLAPVSDAERVPHAVASVLGVREESGRGLLESLADHLGSGQILLILDNCEHLLRPAAELAEHLLRRCAGLRLLATSREWLGVAGEETYRVPSLTVPAADVEPRADSVLRSESARLFLDRAARARPGFRLDDRNAAAVSRLCRRLDGIPLAIELAAPRVRAMDVEEIEAQLDDQLGSLPGPAEAGEPRQRTMEATIRWSYGRLHDEERDLLRGLSVFVGGWTLDGASAACGDGRDAFEVLDLLTGLVDKSLLVLASTEDSECRYRMLEPVREFALSELRASGQESAWRERHLEYYLALGDAAAPELLGGSRQPGWLARLESEHENLLASLDWCDCVETGASKALRLAGSVWRFWYIRSHYGVGRRAVERALARPGARDAGTERAGALSGAAFLALFQGDHAAAEGFGGEALAIYHRHGDRSGEARALVNLALVASERGDHETARALYEQALELHREQGEVRGIATTLNNLAVVARCRDDYEAAQARSREALSWARRGGNLDTIALSLVNLALASTRLGEPDAARPWLLEGLEIVRRIGARRIATAALEVAAEILGARGAPDRAAVLCGAADALRAAIRYAPDPWWAKTHGAAVARLRSELGPRFESMWVEGRGLSLSVALDAAQRWVHA